MIPKRIHYCWFGKEEFPDLTKHCIESWKKFLPDYEITEWNEDNTDIEHEIQYVREAYESKKYAFVSDYFRLKALYEHGGVYFDTDYEILQPIEKILSKGDLISGMEFDGIILTACIAVEKNNPIIKEFLDTYVDRHFIMEDGSYDLTPINHGFSDVLSNYGIDPHKDEFQRSKASIQPEDPSEEARLVDIVIYPREILCGFDVKNWHEKITKKTHGVHHMSSSWAPEAKKKYFRRIQLIQKILGYRCYDFLKENIYDRLKKVIRK